MSAPALNALMNTMILGNTVRSLATAAATFAVVLLLSYLARHVVIARLKDLASRTATDLDDMIVGILSQIQHPEFMLLAFYVGSRGLALHASIDRIVKIVFVTALTYRAVKLLQAVCAYVIQDYSLKRLADDPTARSAMTNAQWILNGALWAGGALFVLDNLGINVTAAVAGLGIGGIAIAMASQSILGDLFSSFTIYIDKPFKVGDFIIVGDMMGCVEHVGIKTTRIRSLSGEMLVFPNSNLTSSRIRNYKLMEQRRVVFGFGVLYETPAEKMKRIPDMVREIVGKVDQTKLDRVHFCKFGDSSLNFEVVYYVLTGDYAVYMDCQQKINLDLMEAFQKEGIVFAYPTQTLYVKKDSA